MSKGTKSRRDALKTGAAVGVGLMLGSGQASAMSSMPKPSTKNRIPVRFDDPKWNRDARARMEAYIDDPSKFSYGFGEGVVSAVLDNQKVRELMRFEIFSTKRIVPQPDGSYQRLLRELVFYRDLETNEIMDEWNNPLTGERVRVVDVANDPFNYVISEFRAPPPDYGGLNKEKPAKIPLLLNWRHLSDDIISLEADIHLHYPSALQPEEWPRESPGSMSRVSELFRFFCRREDLENPDLKHVPSHGCWSRITPWFPWMLMDQAPGHITYMGTMSSRQSLDQYPKDTLERVKARYPEYLEAPTTWEEPSLSSLERYALEQKPAPRKKDL
ncbi:MAG: DUF1838 family protein [Pseudomonadales bacterium]